MTYEIPAIDIALLAGDPEGKHGSRRRSQALRKPSGLLCYRAMAFQNH